MPDIYDSFTTQEKTSKKLNEYRVTNFAYDETAFDDTTKTENVLGQNVYDYNAHNNIPKTTGLSTPTQTLGFGGSSGIFKRSFWNHTVGRISYNLNKTIQALCTLLGSFKEDYSENISEYSEYASYKVGDVCYRLSGNTITFYRCISATSGGPFNGVFWTKPEEELSYQRPAIGVPVLWHDKIPDWAIRFDDGSIHNWVDCPALNYAEFKSLCTSYTGTSFTVPNFKGKVPMFTGDSNVGQNNAVKSGYVGDNFTECVQPHAHTAPAVSFNIPAATTSHTHDNPTCSATGEHAHDISSRCDYDGKSNTDPNRIPVDDVDSYNPATLTNYGGSHGHKKFYTNSTTYTGHEHSITVSGYTGAVKGTKGGNPDSYQSCWIVRYK